MSEQRTEKTHPLHGLEPEQPEQKRCECGACVFEAGPMAWYWQPMQEKMLRRVHEYSHLRIYPNDCGFAHCPGECGCRLSVVGGEPRVVPSAEMLARLIVPHLKDLYHTNAHFNACAATLRSLLLDWRVTPREIAWRYRDAIVDVQESMMLACALFLCVPQLVAVDEQRNDVKPIERLTELAALISGRDADALGGETDGQC